MEEYIFKVFDISCFPAPLLPRVISFPKAPFSWSSNLLCLGVEERSHQGLECWEKSVKRKGFPSKMVRINWSGAYLVSVNCGFQTVCVVGDQLPAMQRVNDGEREAHIPSDIAIPAAIYRSAFRARAGKCFPECFLSAFWRFLGLKMPKGTQKALFGALRGRCPKLPKKHSGGHFPARALKALL